MALQYLGLAALGTGIGSIITGLVTWFAQFMTKRLAVLATVITIIVSLTLAFIAAIEGILAGLTYVAPDLSGAFAILPGNFSACVSAIVSAKLLKWAYGWHVSFVQMKLF